MNKKTSIGLCLSGGGARGLAHIGVFKALEEMGIQADAVSGTSAGAIAGALYAEGLAPEKILDVVKVNSVFKVFSIGDLRYGFSDLKYLKEILEKTLKHDDFKQLKIPFYACVTELVSGTWEIVDSGSIKEAVAASTSIPIIFQPIKKGKKLYVDGGVMNNMPIEPLRERGCKIIGVNINTHGSEKDLSGIPKIANRVFDLALWHNTESRFKQCDVQIDIKECFNYGIFDFNKHQELFEAGYKAAYEQKEELLALKESIAV